jgi:hypothetical protein
VHPFFVVKVFDCKLLILLAEQNKPTKYQWFNGKISACHAGAPGSIPGWCIPFYFCHQFRVTNADRISVAQQGS